jgi:spermidine synthase
LRYDEKTLYTDGKFDVVDMVYAGRPARVLFDGNRSAAQSGMALDNKPELLFDYNQRFLELAEGLKPARLLLIGGGAYTWPIAALRALPHVQIDVVEPDASLDAIAARFFGLKSDKRLRIIHDDGYAFLQKNTHTYDLIIIDAFTGFTIPESLTTIQAGKLLKQSLGKHGTVAMNVVSPYLGRGGERMRGYRHLFESLFDVVAVYPADTKYPLEQSQNFIIVACDKSTALPQLRFSAL